MQTEKMQIAKKMLKDRESIEKSMRYTGIGKHTIQNFEQEEKSC